MQHVETEPIRTVTAAKTPESHAPLAFFLTGTCVVDRSTKRLLKRIQSGQIAVLSHQDLDETAALELIEKNVSAVLNARPTFSGTFESKGARYLLEADIPVFDLRHPQDIRQFVDGMTLWLTERVVGCWSGKRPCSLAAVQRLTWDLWRRRWNDAKANRLTQFLKFAENTWQHACRDMKQLLKPVVRLPLRTVLTGHPALIVVRGPDYKRDLVMLRPYLEQVRPVLIGVDGGADALLEMGYRPDVIVGDMDSVSTEALQCGAELVVHAYPDGHAPGKRRLELLGLEGHVFPIFGTSEDAALMLAYEKGAETLIVVGSHSSMVDFYEKGRPGMGSTWLTRMWVGDRLIDAKGFHQLLQPFYGGERPW